MDHGADADEAAEDEAADDVEDGISWYSMMCVLEDCELTTDDICKEALDGMLE